MKIESNDARIAEYFFDSFCVTDGIYYEIPKQSTGNDILFRIW